MNKLKIVFVCTGNICRSPLAEGVFLNHVDELGIGDQFEVDSCGTSSYHVGSLPDHRAMLTAHQHAIQLSSRARQITRLDLEYNDFILVMDHLNYEDVLSDVSGDNVRNKIFLLRSFDPDTSLEYDVPDPYYGTIDDFEEVFIICERSVKGFVDYLINQKLINPI